MIGHWNFQEWLCMERNFKIYITCKFSDFVVRSLLSADGPYDKSNKVSVRPAKTHISLGIHPVWSESSLSAWRNLKKFLIIIGPLATHWAHSKDSYQTGGMPRLIWVFGGPTLILLVLSCRSSYVGQWPIFHGPMLLPYILKTVWWTDVIVGILDPCDLPDKMYVGQSPTLHGPVILPYILKTIWWINVVLKILIQCDTNIELKLYK